jgi:hypothetical protein
MERLSWSLWFPLLVQNVKSDGTCVSILRKAVWQTSATSNVRTSVLYLNRDFYVAEAMFLPGPYTQ